MASRVSAVLDGGSTSTDSGRAPSSGAPRSWRHDEEPAAWGGVEVTGLLVMALVLGMAQPMFDADLPSHLAMGEWIVRHGRVPFEEPFAWTRPGAPYYAYSWLFQVACYGALALLGPIGLRLLNGVLLAAIALSGWTLGRAMRARPEVGLLLALANVLVATAFTAPLRPQRMLLVVLPLAWALAIRIVDSPPRVARFVGLVLLGAIAANSHLFFPIMLAPLSLVLVAPRSSWPRLLAAGAAAAAGWLLTPYGLHWLAVFRLNFAPNAMLRVPSPITELKPGFVGLIPNLDPAALLVLPLALLPWLALHLGTRERLWAAALWLPGLVGFGMAHRLFIVWWLVAMPVVALVLDRRLGSRAASAPRASIRYGAVVALTAAALSVGLRAFPAWQREGDVRSRRLATKIAQPVDPIAEWLEPRLRPGATGKLFTVFDYGSYVSWRMPSLSPSVDGRAIFPDSVAEAESYQLDYGPPRPVGPYRSADLAILPRAKRSAAVLDTAAGWRRVLDVITNPSRPDTSSLWVTETWWAENARVPLPERPVAMPYDPARPGAR